MLYMCMNDMGNVANDFGNLVQKDIANKIGNKKEQNQWKKGWCSATIKSE